MNSKLLSSALAIFLVGQTTAPLQFEVASVKPTAEEVRSANAPPGARSLTGVVRAFPGGRLTTQGAIVKYIIQSAYRMKPYQIVGGPEWMDSARYDIEAKATDGNATNDQLLLMLQSLLADKFQLKVHRETRQLSVYELSPAKAGARLPAAQDDGCTVLDPTKPRPPTGGANPLTPCGSVAMFGGPTGSRLDGGKVTMVNLIFTLSNMLGRTVIDKTGFTGTFDVHMAFTPDASLEGLPPLPIGANGQRGALGDDPSNGTLFSAIQQQLGLKLDSAKGPVEVLVIDHVEKPASNGRN